MEAQAAINVVAVLQRENIAVVTFQREGDPSDCEPRDRRTVDVRKLANSDTGLGTADAASHDVFPFEGCAWRREAG